MKDMYKIGGKFKNGPSDEKPSFILEGITESMSTGVITYHMKDIKTGKIQKTTEDFLYPMT